ncbi:MAG: site-specific integrase [Xylophilus ampelinus]
MSTYLVQKAMHTTLKEDELRRSDPKHQEWMIQWMQGMGTDVQPAAPLQGMPDALADLLEDTNQQHGTEFGKALARGKLMKAFPGLQYMAAQQGVHVGPNTPGLEPALRAYLAMMVEAKKAQIARDGGRVVPTPPEPVLATSVALETPSQLTLRDVFNRWKETSSTGIHVDTVRARERALEAYEETYKDVPIASITRDQGHDFKAKLMKSDLAPSTAADRLMYVVALFSYASREMECIPKNPWEKITIKPVAKTKRRPWTDTQIEAYFDQPLYTSYKLPGNVWKSGGAASYWIPLLALFSGARVGELVQLHKEDVYTEDGVPVIDINENDETKSVKTDAARRRVPVHRELIRLGFLDYVGAMPPAEDTTLWPGLHLKATRSSTAFSRYFKETLRSAPAIPIPTFHELRHLVRTTLARKKVEEQIINLLLGHEVRGSVGATVYTHYTVADLQEAVNKIEYPTFRLNRTYQLVDSPVSQK